MPIEVPYDILLQAPIKRAAYSDRTAWIMAMMSKLAYVRFEKATSIESGTNAIMKLVTGQENPQNQGKKIDKGFTATALLSILRDIANAEDRADQLADMQASLEAMNFELVKTFSVSIPFITDTQAFIAKMQQDGRPPFLVLSFRGTEPKKPADIKSDLDAVPHIIGYFDSKNGGQLIPADHKDVAGLKKKLFPAVKVHAGFWKAFHDVKTQIEDILNSEEHRDLPLYITGHSLGGALAIVATYALNDDRVASCYTFGGPRVGNLQFNQLIRPPVYRVVNAADIVPRLPPGVLVDVLTIGLRWLPGIPGLGQIADFLERFRGYRHYGDMRYLTAASSLSNTDGKPEFSNLRVISNPPQITRWFWTFRRYLATRGMAAAGDHNIDIYEQKLAYWAYIRSLGERSLKIQDMESVFENQQLPETKTVNIPPDNLQDNLQDNQQHSQKHKEAD